MKLFERLGPGGKIVQRGIPGFMVGIAVCALLGFGKTETIQAQAKAPKAANAETIVVAAPNAAMGSTQFVIVDTREKAFAVYEIDPSKKLKLLAARPYEWDLKIEHNNLPPLVRDVEQMVKTPPATPNPR